MKVFLIGGESAGMQLLRWLSDGPHQLVGAAVEEPDDTRRVNLTRVAQRLGVDTWAARRVRDAAFAEEVPACDVLINAHSLHIVDPAILDVPKVGAFNLHPGALPEYAGLNSASWALYHGRAEHGVTLHHMAAGIDTGDIAYQRRFPITDSDTALTLNAKSVRLGLELIEDLLHDATLGTVPSLPQDLAQRQYFGREVPEDGRLSWDRPAAEIERFVRACDFVPFESPWGHPRTELDGVPVEIAKATATPEPCDAVPGDVGTTGHEGVRVACADSWMAVETVRVSGSLVDARRVLKRGQRLCG